MPTDIHAWNWNYPKPPFPLQPLPCMISDFAFSHRTWSKLNSHFVFLHSSLWHAVAHSILFHPWLPGLHFFKAFQDLKFRPAAQPNKPLPLTRWKPTHCSPYRAAVDNWRIQIKLAKNDNGGKMTWIQASHGSQGTLECACGLWWGVKRSWRWGRGRGGRGAGASLRARWLNY